MRKSILLLAAAGSFAAAALVLAEPAITVKQIDLKQNPSSEGKTVATVAAGTSVNLVKREGAWVQLQTGKNTGWAKVFDIGLPAASGKAAATPARSGNAQAPSLDAATLGKATPNPQEWTLLLTFATSKEQAQAFAKAGKLEARKVERNQ
jgi:hypothetical protein